MDDKERKRELRFLTLNETMNSVTESLVDIKREGNHGYEIYILGD